MKLLKLGAILLAAFVELQTGSVKAQSECGEFAV